LLLMNGRSHVLPQCQTSEADSNRTACWIRQVLCILTEVASRTPPFVVSSLEESRSHARL
jgi:hypothetical protein